MRTTSLRTTCLVLGASALLVLAACGDDDDAIGFDDLAVVTDDAEPIRAEIGSSIFIELPANPTTGYQWIVTGQPDEAVARIVTQDYVPDEVDEDVVGSGGIERWELEATGPGATTLDLEYRGPGDDADVAETRSFVIEVPAD